jgi:hypothetical protein
MYDNIAKVHGISRENCIISLKRSEWQQPENVFPPLHKRLTGQRRRRILGAFPETENDVRTFHLHRSMIVFFPLIENRLASFTTTSFRKIWPDQNSGYSVTKPI